MKIFSEDTTGRNSEINGEREEIFGFLQTK